MTSTTVPLAPVRRWIGRTQSAHRERGATAGNLYFAALFIAVVGGMLHKQVAVVFWPAAPNSSGLAGASLVLILFGLLYLALRRFGPLALSRPAASWLMQAPVSRRRLLFPSMRLAAIVAAIAGGRWGDAVDTVASLLLAAGFAGLVTAVARDQRFTAVGWPGTSVLGPVVGGLALVVLVVFAFAIRGLERTPNQRILEAAKTAGTLFDSAFGMEPSFLTDMLQRNYWSRRRLRSVRFPSWMPPLIAQDLLLTLRRRNRLAWLALAAVLPALFGHGPHWVAGVAVLFGLLYAGLTSVGNVKTDAGNPMMLRLLGLSSRQAVLQRMVVPGVLAGVWAAVTLSVLRALGDLPPGPWWALGLVLGPVGAAAAVHRGRVGFVRNELLPLDTPQGTISPGPLVNAVMGPDMLLLGLPTLIEIAQGHPLSWMTVLTQAVVGLIGARAYLSGTTAGDRVEFSSR